MMDLEITKEEQNALKKYLNDNYEIINQLLVSNSESDLALFSEEVEGKPILLSYDKDSVVESLDIIKKVYSLILKQYYKTNPSTRDFYRGTNLAELDRLKSEVYIDRMLSATPSKEEANKFALDYSKPVRMNLSLENSVPYIVISDIIKRYRNKEEILISPFTKIIKFDEEISDEESKISSYNIKIEKQALDNLTENERNGLYSYIIDNAYLINRKLEDCMKLEKENGINFENIRKLEQLLSKYENTIDDKEIAKNYSDMDREADYNDIKRINKELDEIKRMSTELFDMRKQNINFVNIWKRNIAVYMIAECREIEKEIEKAIVEKENNSEEKEDGIDMKKEVKKEKVNTKEKEEIKENIENAETEVEAEVMSKMEPEVELKLEPEVEKVEDASEATEKDEKENLDENKVSEEIKNEKEVEENVEELNNKKEVEEKVDEVVDEIVEKDNSKDNDKEPEIKEEKTIKNDTIIWNVQDKSERSDELLDRVREEAEENIEETEKLLTNISSLIAKQQNHARIAGNVGATYSALNNGFEMRTNAEKLKNLLDEINMKIAVLGVEERTEENREKLEKVSKASIEISTLLNYLNNPKIAPESTSATRFDELYIIEENELKRRIAEEVRGICAEAELKKLKDDMEIIQDKSAFQKVIGVFTGRNRLDNFMIDQIIVRQTAIRRTLSQKLLLSHNYSIHDLMAKIMMFINENDDDELVEKDVRVLKELAEELKRNYVIVDSKVKSIVEQREGDNLPLDKRLSKRDIIEVETYRFLNKYGYDIPDSGKVEPEYQDTMAHEIGMIVEYINSSKIL